VVWEVEERSAPAAWFDGRRCGLLAGLALSFVEADAVGANFYHVAIIKRR